LQVSCRCRLWNPQLRHRSSPTGFKGSRGEPSPSPAVVIGRLGSPVGKAACPVSSGLGERWCACGIWCCSRMEASPELPGQALDDRDLRALPKSQGSFRATQSTLHWRLIVALLATAQPLVKQEAAEVDAPGLRLDRDLSAVELNRALAGLNAILQPARFQGGVFAAWV
jgi:hypothetical protein